MLVGVLAGIGFAIEASAQDAAAPAAAAPAAAPAVAPATAAPGMELDKKAAEAEAAEAKKPSGLGFFQVIISSGFLGVILWLGLGGSSVAAASLAIDSFVTIRQKKIVPEKLVADVRSSMEQGDVMKALQALRERSGPAVEHPDGRVPQREGRLRSHPGAGRVRPPTWKSEKLMQRVTYLNVMRQHRADARTARHGAGHDHGVRQPGHHAGRRGPAGHAGLEHLPGAVDDGRRPGRGHPGRDRFYTCFKNRRHGSS